MKKTNIEVEGGEILLESKEGHYAVIPAKHRQEVMDMVKDGCDDCINNYIQTLPKDSDYAEDGTLIPEDKKKITFEQKPYIAVPSTTYVEPKAVAPLGKIEEQSKTFEKPTNTKASSFKGKAEIYGSLPEELVEESKQQDVLRADTRDAARKEMDKKYVEAVLNPSIRTQIGEAFQKPLRYTSSPLKYIGDRVSAIAPNSELAKALPNTKEEVLESRKKKLNPYTTTEEKRWETINEARELTINSLVNAGAMELGFALPRSFVSPAMTNMFRVGSKSNFAADILQLSKLDLDKIADGDMNQIADLILNSSSLLSKMNNFDASTVYNNIKNWKSISKSDKIDTYKDIFNISQSINQQTQRK